jgi:F1F0 ATPase subunit 2
MPLLAAALSGLALGALNFTALAANARLYLTGGNPLVPFALQLLRLGGLVAAMILAVRFGASALLAVFAGFLVARQLAVRLVRR